MSDYQRDKSLLEGTPPKVDPLDHWENDRIHREERERLWAQKKIANHIKAGKLKSQPCQICGYAKTEAHHKDHSKPYDVVWLCKEHHDVITQRRAHLEI